MIVRIVVYSLHVHNVCMNMSSAMVAYVFFILLLLNAIHMG
jgi:hypothetical protein